jgi:hypothetical protein
VKATPPLDPPTPFTSPEEFAVGIAPLMRSGTMATRLKVVCSGSLMTAYTLARFSGESHVDVIQTLDMWRVHVDDVLRTEGIDARRDIRATGRVYAIRSDAGQIKLGFTKGPVETRRSGLQTGSPHRLQVIADWPGTPYDEQLLHQQFAARRLAGEWFDDADRCISEHVCELEVKAR